MVMNMVKGRPASEQRLLETDMMNSEVAQPIDNVAERCGTCHQKYETGGQEQQAQTRQAQRDNCRQEKGQRIVAKRILVMYAVTFCEQRNPGMEYPAMKEILDETEGQQADRNGQEYCQRTAGMPSPTFEYQHHDQRHIHTEFGPVARSSGAHPHQSIDTPAY